MPRYSPEYVAALQDQRDALQAKLAEERAWRTKLLAPIVEDRETLRAALEPFAALYGPHLDSKRDAAPVFGINDATITVGQLRAAREALRSNTDQHANGSEVSVRTMQSQRPAPDVRTAAQPTAGRDIAFIRCPHGVDIRTYRHCDECERIASATVQTPAGPTKP